jgi:4-hydroxybenzoate polyprenyltransferase
VGAKAYLRLIRIQTGAVTAIVPVWGYVAGSAARGHTVSVVADGQALATVFLLGLLAHVFGFVHNEFVDRELDARVAYRSPKPLAAGEVTAGAARAIAGAALAAGLALALAIAPGFPPTVLVFTAGAAALAAAYNVLGKKMAGGEVWLSACAAMFALAGACAAGGLSAAFAPGPVIIAAFFGTFLFQGSIQGAYKDQETDAAQGLRTLALRLAPPGSGDAGRRRLFAGGALVHAAVAALVVIGIAGPFSMGVFPDIVRLALAGVSLLLMLMAFARCLKASDRRRMMALISAHELLGTVLLLALAWPVLLPGIAAGLALLPVVWYLGGTAALYGTLGAPDV